MGRFCIRREMQTSRNISATDLQRKRQRKRPGQQHRGLKGAFELYPARSYGLSRPSVLEPSDFGSPRVRR